MTIKEIAGLAGVSPATVSRYFNNGYLSQEKKEKIERVVSRTGYRPSPQAQMLRTHRANMVGVILPRIESNSIARIVAGISSVMNQNNVKILLASTQNNPDTELAYLEVFDEKQVDGVIFVATVMSEKHHQMIRESRVPVVVIGQQVEEADCIFHDDYHATYELVQLMAGRGRKHIAYIAALEEDLAVGHDRTKGYRDAMLAEGLALDEGRMATAEFSMGSGYEVMKEILRKHTDTDAVIAATDTIAVGALRAIRESGYDVPKDILLAGIGNSPMSVVTTPMLTTMHYEYEESGKKAAEILLKRIAEQEAEGEMEYTKLVLGHELIKRESTE